jgi:hypothetical protein
MRRNEHLVQLVYYGGLSDSGIAGDQYQLLRAALNDAVEGGEQRPDLALTSVQFLRNQKAVWPVMFSQREIVDFASLLPCGKTTPEVALEARRGLITLFRSLGKPLHNDCRDRDRHVLRPLVGRYGLSCDMAMHPLHWVRRGEGQTARNHFVKRHSKGVEVAACVDRTIHPPGLLRRHVGECSCDELGRSRQLAFARKTRGDIETLELQITCSTYEDIVRLDILMDQAALVDPLHCRDDGYS